MPLHESVIDGLFSVTEQEFTFVADHAIVEVFPDWINDGVAVIERSGLSTVMVTERWPPFEQMTVYWVVDDGETSVDPDTAPPVEKLTPELLVELTQDHASVAVSPLFIVPEEAENDGGAALTVTTVLAFAVPPVPEQLTEYCVVPEGETDVEPETAPPVLKFVPVQLDALVLPHVRVEEDPLVIVDGFAEIDAVGGEH